MTWESDQQIMFFLEVTGIYGFILILAVKMKELDCCNERWVGATLMVNALQG